MRALSSRESTRPAASGATTAVAALTVAAAALAAGCTLPLTQQTLTGGALQAGALLFVDQYNEGHGEGVGVYRYDVRADADTLAKLFEAAVAEANRTHMFPAASASRPARPAGPDAETDAAAESGEDGVVLARAAGRAWRPDDPPEPEVFSQRQWTPAPPFTIRAGSPEARGDTLTWIVTHRASRHAALVIVPRADGDGTRIVLLPYDPPNDILLSVPADHAQRNAVEVLHQAFYFVLVEHLGPDVLRPHGPEGEEPGDVPDEVPEEETPPEGDLVATGPGESAP